MKAKRATLVLRTLSGRTWLWVGLCAACWCGPRSVEAQDVAAARAAFLDADFEAARTQLDGVLANPDATTDELAGAFALQATLVALEGGEPRPSVERALALDPHAGPVEGSPRSVADTFDRIRGEQAGHALDLRLATTGEGEERELAVALEHAPSGLVARVVLVCGGLRAQGAMGAELIVGEAAAHCEARAETEAGAVVVRAEHDVVALLSTSSTASNDDTAWIVAGVIAGVLVVGAAITVGVVAANPGGQATLGAPVVLEW